MAHPWHNVTPGKNIPDVEVGEFQPPKMADPIIKDALHRESEQRRKGFK